MRRKLGRRVVIGRNKLLFARGCDSGAMRGGVGETRFVTLFLGIVERSGEACLAPTRSFILVSRM